MTNDPDQLRAEIEGTRESLSRNVDALTESVRPGNVARRQGNRITGSVSGLKDRIMGSPDPPPAAGGYHTAGAVGRQSRSDALREQAGQTQEAAGQRLGDAREAAGQRLGEAQAAVQDAPAAARRRTQGNPLAAGVVAAGIGFVIGSLLPSTQQERDASVALKEQVAEPVRDEVKTMAQDAGDSLRPQVEGAVDSVKGAASDAAATVKAEGQAAASDVQSSAQSAKDNVQAEGQSAAGDVQSSAQSARENVQDQQQRS